MDTRGEKMMWCWGWGWSMAMMLMPFERLERDEEKARLEGQEHPIVHLVVHCYIAVCPTSFANQIKCMFEMCEDM